MGIQCRAKDPNSCRVHGTSGSYEKLQAIADRAALSGNTSLYMDMRAQMDALSDDISGDAVEAAASARWSGGRWEKMSAGIKSLARANARLQLEAAVPHLKDGVVSMAAVNAYAKTAWELRVTNGKWALATVEDRKAHRADARKALEAASPHMVGNDESSSRVDNSPELLSDNAVEAAASEGLEAGKWLKMRSSVKNLYLQDARVALAAGVPYMRHGQIPAKAVEAIAKASWEGHGNGSWSSATNEDKLSWRIRADRMLVAAAPHIKLQ